MSTCPHCQGCQLGGHGGRISRGTAFKVRQWESTSSLCFTQAVGAKPCRSVNSFSCPFHLQLLKSTPAFQHLLKHQVLEEAATGCLNCILRDLTLSPSQYECIQFTSLEVTLGQRSCLSHFFYSEYQQNDLPREGIQETLLAG